MSVQTATAYFRHLPCEKRVFLTGLEKIVSIPLGSGPARFVWYTAYDLANLVGCGPVDVIDKTADLADCWDHPDESHYWREHSDVKAWINRCCHGNHAGDIMIRFRSDGHEQALFDALYG